MVELETISILLTSVGMIIALSYYALTIRNQNRTRQAQLLMDLYETYRSPGFRKQQQEIFNLEWTDYEDFWEKYGGQNNPDTWANWLSAAGFYNGIGVLLKRKMLDIDLVEELLSNITLVSWDRMGPILKGWRESPLRFGAHTRSSKYDLMSGFEYLYNEMRQRDRQYSELKT